MHGSLHRCASTRLGAGRCPGVALVRLGVAWVIVTMTLSYSLFGIEDETEYQYQVAAEDLSSKAPPFYLSDKVVALGLGIREERASVFGRVQMRISRWWRCLGNYGFPGVESVDPESCLAPLHSHHGMAHIPGSWFQYINYLRAHPSRRRNQSEAKFLFVGAEHGSWPQLDHSSYYVVFDWWSDRRDVFCVDYDLRDLKNDTRELCPGVTLPPPKFFTGGPRDGRALESWRWLVGFMARTVDGWWNTSHARRDIEQAFKGVHSDRVFVRMRPGKGTGEIAAARHDYNDLLSNSAFSLVVHGDQRWNYRFSEALGACSVPVIIADGLTLPFEELIDWTKASLRVPESMASNASAILELLEQRAPEAPAMRREACRIYEKYFATMPRRVNGLLLSLEKRALLHEAHRRHGVA
mmetsp:Transcript_48908/g.140548  ORF Transcript_48908/g.140548 Transcript_48908/m.140548 type:complete len:410 (+) Transcript_48908:50-1279(+)